MKVFQYNVLADFLCRGQDTEWEMRRVKILAKISNANPSIVCLQEVQSTGEPNSTVLDHADWFEEQLNALGYACFYSRRPGSGLDIGNLVCWQRNAFEVERPPWSLRLCDLAKARCNDTDSKRIFGSTG